MKAGQLIRINKKNQPPRLPQQYIIGLLKSYLINECTGHRCMNHTLNKKKLPENINLNYKSYYAFMYHVQILNNYMRRRTMIQVGSPPCQLMMKYVLKSHIVRGGIFFRATKCTQTAIKRRHFNGVLSALHFCNKIKLYYYNNAIYQISLYNTNPYLKLSVLTSCDCLTIAGNLLSTGLYTGATTLGATGTGAMIGAGVTALTVGNLGNQLGILGSNPGNLGILGSTIVVLGSIRYGIRSCNLGNLDILGSILVDLGMWLYFIIQLIFINKMRAKSDHDESRMQLMSHKLATPDL
ncbi:hypothetical protein AGLY_014876 [Aphis glycines]|uniref:Uncharacterized protein n=1 Tax=Aphis glycines TaxID=307491 RepID=A0A6G0T2G4_APHGL|nr:hypothetical protein AGLY_014876 [Aphis glycines]